MIEICKVRKRQHQNPEFVHKDGDIKKEPAKKNNIQQRVKLRKPSFFLSASTLPTYIFIVPTCIASMIPLGPYALNAEFQHFILRYNKISLLYGYHGKRG